MSDVAVSVKDVSKRFKIYHERNQSIKQMVLRRKRHDFEEFWALKDVSVDIPSGSTFGFIGVNGSGKSTLLKLIAKILVPDKGTIRSKGTVAALLELGTGFHPELSGRENIFLNGALLGIREKELAKKFDQIVEFSGIERFIDTPVKNYSSGMYVRLGFAVAINVSPDILLIDEVLAVGDAEFQLKCADKFVELQASGCTIIIVTHAMGSIREMCSSAALLENGSIRALGPAKEVVAQYLSQVEEHITGELRIPPQNATEL